MSRTEAPDFERGILGCVLRDNGIWPLVESLVREDHFSLDSHRQIYGAMKRLFSAGKSIDGLTIAEEFGGLERIKSIGGIAYIFSLEEGMFRFPEERVRTYADRIRQAWQSREMARLGEEMALRAISEGPEALPDHQKRLEAILCDCGVEESTAESCADGVLERWEKEHRLNGSPAIGFGIPQLDEAIGGMFPGHQVVAGARSGVGKTRLMIQAAAAVCSLGFPAQMNLIEPTKDEFLRGLAAFYAGLRASVASEPYTARPDERERFYNAVEVIRKWPLTIYDRASMSLDEIVGRGRVAIRKGCRLIGVDYLQRVYVPQLEKGEQMRLKVARASTALANLVKDTQCTSLVLSQLRRTEAMGIPTMQDLRESGQIENDAHLILLLHRDYDSDKGIFKETGAFVVPKRRFGPPTNRRAYFNSVDASWEDGDRQTETHWSDR
jgi:replicative DNA helicase